MVPMIATIVPMVGLCSGMLYGAIVAQLLMMREWVKSLLLTVGYLGLYAAFLFVIHSL